MMGLGAFGGGIFPTTTGARIEAGTGTGAGVVTVATGTESTGADMIGSDAVT